MGIDGDEVASFAPALQPDIGRLEYLYASSQRRLVIEMAAYTGDIAAAEDLVQEAFGRCIAKWAVVAGYDNPEAWVRLVAYNTCALALAPFEKRGESARGLGRGEVQSGPEAGNTELMIAVSRLGDDERQVIVRHYLLDQPVAVVAAQLGIPEGTVKSRLARGRARLAEMLTADGIEGDRNE